MIPAALLSALIVANTVTLGQQLVIDARLPGVAAAAVAAWRKLPFPAVIAIGAGVTALVRALAVVTRGAVRSGGDQAGVRRPAEPPGRPDRGRCGRRPAPGPRRAG